MDATPIVLTRPVNLPVAIPIEPPGAARSAFSASSYSICFESICKSILDLFLGVWKCLRILFCKAVSVVYMIPPEVVLWSIKIQIEEKDFHAVLNTGCDCILSLKKECLDTIDDKEEHEDAVVGYSGKLTRNAAYEVREGILGESSIEELVIAQYPEKKDAAALPEDVDGVLGLPYFEWLGSVFMDYSNGQIFDHQSNDRTQISILGYKLENFTAVPLEYTKKRESLILRVETDFRILRFLLDTSAATTGIRISSVNLLNYDPEISNLRPYCTTSSFRMGDRDFGSTDLALIELDDDLDFDGILGMDFLSKYAIDLNVRKCTLLIGDSFKKNKED